MWESGEEEEKWIKGQGQSYFQDFVLHTIGRFLREYTDNGFEEACSNVITSPIVKSVILKNSFNFLSEEQKVYINLLDVS